MMSFNEALGLACWRRYAEVMTLGMALSYFRCYWSSRYWCREITRDQREQESTGTRKRS